MPFIWLVRHGDHDYRDPLPETVGQGLTGLGREQARATARHLSESTGSLRRIICSDYLRAKQTARIIAEALPDAALEIDARFRECSDIYYQHRARVSQAAPRVYRRLFQSPRGIAVPTLVVCHANLIRYLLSRLSRWTEARWESVLIGNCSISVVDVQTGPPRQRTVLMEASLAHLPPDLRETW